MSVVGASVKVR